MNACARALLISCVSLIALTVGVAHARTPTPTPTPTATATATSSPTPTLRPTATPTLPPEQVAKFSGEVWLDAFGGYDRIGVGAVTARIGDIVCGVEPPSCPEPICLHPPVDPQPLIRGFHLDVVPAEEKSGCGYEGAPVTFYVGGIQAAETAVWHAGAVQEVNLAAGHSFALFQGTFTLAFQPAETIGTNRPAGMIALIGDEVCGQEIRGIWRGRDAQGNDVYRYSVLVYSNEQQHGCGVEGDEVVFRLIWNRGPGNANIGDVVAMGQEKGAWHAWDGTPPEFNLTMVPVDSIKLGNVGDGASQGDESGLWGLPAMLATLGLTALAAGIALRRRSAA